MVRLMNLLNERNMALSAALRVKPNKKSFINPDNFTKIEDKREAIRLNGKISRHPNWVKLEREDSYIHVFFSTETTKKVIDKQTLLRKIDIPASDYQIVGNGYYKKYDTNNTQELNELITIIDGFKPFIPDHNKDLIIPEIPIYQDIRVCESQSGLISHISIQSDQLIAIPSKEIIDGHTIFSRIDKLTLPLDKKREIYKNSYYEHLKESKNSTLTEITQNDHSNIANKMLTLIKNTLE